MAEDPDNRVLDAIEHERLLADRIGCLFGAAGDLELGQRRKYRRSLGNFTRDASRRRSFREH